MFSLHFAGLPIKKKARRRDELLRKMAIEEDFGARKAPFKQRQAARAMIDDHEVGSKVGEREMNAERYILTEPIARMKAKADFSYF